jgi:hypothetical protein
MQFMLDVKAFLFWSRQAYFILSYETEFYKQTILKEHLN